ncbi:MAG: peptide chain release factor 2 [Planctomycetes bacterium]|nr:peptide chain release factor 2 [Planctomycetota bacterium]
MSEAVNRIKELRREYAELARALKLDKLEQERHGLEDKMAQPDFWDDQERAQETVLRLKSVKAETDAFSRVRAKLEDVEVLAELAEAEDDAGARAEVARELEAAEKGIGELQLRTYFTGEHDALGAFVAIQAGAGGVDACDWAEMVLRMLTRYAERRGFDVELMDLNPEEPAGIRSGTILVKGRGAFGWLKSERGTHRLVRISPFDAQARRQTAFAAVDVTPEFDEKIEVDINDADLRVDTFSAGGPGGQHVNKTQSAIRITHLPSGIVVQCQTQRNQHANRRRAMQMLKNRLYQQEVEKREAAAMAGYANKSNMGFGAADRIRSYTLQPFTLVKDSRTDHEETDVQEVLDGGLDPFVESYLKWAAAGGDAKGGNGAE